MLVGAVRILFFAQARIDTGRSEASMAVEGPLTQEQFWAMQIPEAPALAAHQKASRLARNGTYMLPDDMIQPGDEIAIIPPVSGG
jgi:molybdopterin converting factor small subunit